MYLKIQKDSPYKLILSHLNQIILDHLLNGDRQNLNFKSLISVI